MEKTIRINGEDHEVHDDYIGYFDIAFWSGKGDGVSVVCSWIGADGKRVAKSLNRCSSAIEAIDGMEVTACFTNEG